MISCHTLLGKWGTGRCQAIIWTSAGKLSIGTLGKNFSKILIEIVTFSLKKMPLKVSSAKLWPFCFSCNVLNSDGWWEWLPFLNIVRCIYFTEDSCILTMIFLNFVPQDSIDEKFTMDQVMNWHWTGDKPSSDLMFTQICDKIHIHAVLYVDLLSVRNHWLIIRNDILHAFSSHTK